MGNQLDEARLPAVCMSCSRPFQSAYAVGNEALLFMTMARSGPCPHCGGVGMVPDGAYQQVQGILSHIASTNATLADITSARDALAQLLAERVTEPEVIAQRLTEAGPVGKTIWKAFGSSKAANIIAILALAYTATQFHIQTTEKPDPPVVNVTVNYPPANPEPSIRTQP